MSALREALAQLTDVSSLSVRGYDESDRLSAAVARVELLALDAAVTIESHRKPDRSTVLRMAGNIAAGLCTDDHGWSYEDDDGRELIARTSVDIARRIMRITDGVKP